MNLIASGLWGYMVGGIPTGILITKALTGQDPRKEGSGSSGATNVSRVLGKKWGIVVLLLDALKGYLPVTLFPTLICGVCAPGADVTAAIGAVVGHVYTPYANFKGGKGVATAAGAMAALDWRVLLMALAVWAVVFVLTRRVSPASLLAAISYPIIMWLDKRPEPMYIVIGSAAIALFLWFTHRENIRRLLSSNEPRFF